MAPSRNCATAKNKRRQRATSSQTRTALKKSIPTQRAGIRKSLRLRNKPLFCDTDQSRHVQSSPTTPAPIPQPAHTKRKRPQDADELEDFRPPKQVKDIPTPELSEANLRLFNKSMGEPESIESFSSQRSSTQLSGSITNGRYRIDVLRPNRIRIEWSRPPKHIHDAIRTIVDAECSEGRREQLQPIAQQFLADCTQNARSPTSENDFLAIFLKTISLMEFNKLAMSTKVNWGDQLEPKVQDFLDHENSQNSSEVWIPPPRKRHQQATGQTNIVTQPSMADGSNPPPANTSQELDKMPPHVRKEKPKLKTPCPGITMGIKMVALISGLLSQGFNQLAAEELLEQLQKNMDINERSGMEEPYLFVEPARPQVADLTFPFGVVENKGHMTGKQICEAQNQAAVSGACALYIQHRLDELVERKTAESSRDQPPTSLKDQTPGLTPPSEEQIPLFFSICTEGPIHMLWVHWIEVEDGHLQYHMDPLKCVYGCLLDGLMDFFVMVDNILRWGTGHFLESLVLRLAKLA